MSKILIVAEHDGAKLNPSTLKCVACAAKVPGASVDIAVLAADSSAVAAQAAGVAGVGKVIAVDNAANKEPLAAVLAPQVARLAAGYTHVFGPSTTFGKDLMPRVAALLGVGQVSDIMAVEGAHRFKRPIYAGNAVLTVEVPADAEVVATVRIASWSEAAATGGSAAVEKADPGVALRLAHALRVAQPARRPDRPDLQSASACGGRRPRARQRRRLQASSTALPTSSARPSVRLTRRGGRGLRAERPPGRPDGQDHRAGALFRHRHLAAPSST